MLLTSPTESNDFLRSSLGFPALEDCTMVDLVLSVEDFFVRLEFVGYMGGNEVAGEFFLEFAADTLSWCNIDAAEDFLLLDL